MTTIFLIRHGLTAATGTRLYGQTAGFHLDARGRAQAEGLATRLAPVRLTAIYSSPLERCVETVEPLAAAQRLPVVSRDELIEMDAGEWTGRTLNSLRRTKRWSEVQRSPSTFRFPGGEGFAEAQVRVVAEIERIARRHRRGRVAVATHGDIVRILLAHLAGTPLDEFQRTVIATASVSVVHLGSDRPMVLLVNDICGLEAFAGGTLAAAWESPQASDGSTRGSRLRGHANLRG
jgi:probable phosphomutase (TIGR03848 family)